MDDMAYLLATSQVVQPHKPNTFPHHFNFVNLINLFTCTTVMLIRCLQPIVLVVFFWFLNGKSRTAILAS